MRKVGFFIAGVIFACYSQGQTVTGPKVWLKGDSLHENESIWADASLNDLDASYSGKISRDFINYNPSLVLDGEAFLAIDYNVDSLSDLTVFSIFQCADSLESVIWSSEHTLDRTIYLTTARALGPDSTYDIFEVNAGIATSNMVFQRWEKAEELSEEASFWIGKSAELTDYKTFNGLFAEFMLFDRALSFLERVQVETYLSIKHGISKSSGNYVSSSEMVLWDRKKYEDFGHHIIGLGRDDGFHLYQKQSVSASDTSAFLIFSAGPLASVNEENMADLPDQNFIVLGDNDEEFVMTTPDEQTGLQVLARRWLVSAAGASACEIPTTLQLDFNRIPPDSLGYWLVVNSAGTDFETDHLDFIKPDSVNANGIAFFNSLTWDEDRSGKDAFSLAQQKALFARVQDVSKPLCTAPGTGEASFKIISGSAPYRYRVMNRRIAYDHAFNGGDYVTETGLDAGEYQLMITDAKGMEFTRTFTIGIQDAIEFDLGSEIDLTDIDSIRLDAYDFIADSMNVTFRWANNFGFSSSGPQVTISESGIYTLYVTNEEGCTFSDELVVAGSPFQKVAVYPSISPEGFYSVNISLEEANDVHVKVFDMSGHLEASRDGSGQREYRFEGNLPEQGMYLIQIETPDGFTTRKVIKR